MQPANKPCTDLVFDVLVVADYIDEIECTDGSNNQNA